MQTETLEPMAIIDSKTPTFSFQGPEKWNLNQPAIQLQLTTRNLRSLGAAFKSLNVPGQTPRVSPSPSDSSSDSESNHRIYRSTKRVCVREDMNTTREISPRPSRPVEIIIPDPLATGKASWVKPDTPAPWHTSIHSGAHDKDEDHALTHVPGCRTNVSDVVIQLNGLSLSPQKTSSFINRIRNTSKSATSGNSTTMAPKGRSCGNGVGIRRYSHSALPRPRSLSKSSGLPLAGNLPSPSRIPGPGASHPKTGDIVNLAPCIRSAGACSLPEKFEFTPSFTIRGPATDMIDPLAEDLNYYPMAPAKPFSGANSLLSDHLRQPRTYVDHVRAQRLPPSDLPRKFERAEAQDDVELQGEDRFARQRSASV